MLKSAHFSHKALVFHGKQLPEEATVVGYSAIIYSTHFEIPDKLIAILVRFLEQNGGVLSKRAQEKEFERLSKKEIQAIEETYREVFSTI